MNAWLHARPWWQELLIYWLTGSACMYLVDEIQSARDSIYDPLVAAMIGAATITGVGRWKRRYDRKEDVD